MYRIGVDLGGTNIVAGVVDEYYRIVGKGKMPTACPRPSWEIINDVALSINMALEEAKISLDEVVSIGIGTPGSVNKNTELLSMPIIWDSIMFRQKIFFNLSSANRFILKTMLTVRHSAKQKRAPARGLQILWQLLSVPALAAELL